MLVLAIFGLLQLTSAVSIFFDALKHDEEFHRPANHSPATIHLNGSWVALLQTRNTLNRAGIRYMMDKKNNIGSGSTVNKLMQDPSASEQAERDATVSGACRATRVRATLRRWK
ncbi:Tar ligand binding domain-containing protein [Shigella flexneri]